MPASRCCSLSRCSAPRGPRRRPFEETTLTALPLAAAGAASHTDVLSLVLDAGPVAKFVLAILLLVPLAEG